VRYFFKDTAALVDGADCNWDFDGNASALAPENPFLGLTGLVRADTADPRQQALHRG
jgi:hypothetical protein